MKGYKSHTLQIYELNLCFDGLFFLCVLQNPPEVSRDSKFLTIFTVVWLVQGKYFML